MLFYGLAFAWIPSRSFAEGVFEGKPLATCAVQELAEQGKNIEMSEAVVLNGYQAPQADPLANYARSTDGQWLIPQQVDRDNPWLRLLVLGPEKPSIIDVAIYVDGAPFTEARERLIDGLLDHASVETLVRDAVKVPIPEDKTKTPETTKGESDSPDVADSKNPDKEERDSTKDSKKNKDKKSDKSKPELPFVEVQRRAARTVAQRLVNYMASSDVKADREEVRWLLAEWAGGPAILTSGPAMNWQRVGIAPLWNALDVDADQKLSEAEIAAASERLKQADVDENSIVELEELFAMGSNNTTAPHGYPLVIMLDQETNWQQLNSHLQVAYSRRSMPQQGLAVSATSALLTRILSGDQTLTLKDLEQLLNETADVKLCVTLGGKENEDQVALLAATPDEHSASEHVVTVLGGADYLEFSAGEAKEKEVSEPSAAQIAIGAVVDGYPLFRLVDRNGDRRLSPRESRNMPAVLTSLDLNADGQIDSHEKPTAIRIAITRGPHAHEMLAEPTSAMREFATVGATTKPDSSAERPVGNVPAWFTDMDRNRDGDVSRGEFLGTTEQFKQLDSDGDGLLGSQEASE